MINNWISVKDRLPPPDVKVLVKLKDSEQAIDICSRPLNSRFWKGDREYYTIDLITHWQPLPEPPEK